jgi:hypothetical protein
MKKLAILREFLTFLRAEKKLWLTPIVLCLLIMGFILVAVKGSAIAPFIYSFF